MTIAVGLCSSAHVHASDYARALAEREDATLAWVTDPDADRGRAFASEWDVAFLEDGDAPLNRADGVIVCAPTADHREWLERAIAAGVPALCEKPLATTLADADAIVDAWRAGDVPVGVAMPLRHSPAVTRLASLLEAGDLGEVIAVSGTNRGQFPGGWFGDPELAGGGAVMDHTVHLVDLVTWLTGEPVREVFAETATRFHDIPVADVNVCSMRLADGTPFLLDGSWSRPDSWHTWGDATLEVVGEVGTCAIDCTGESLSITRAGSEGGLETVAYGADMTGRLVEDLVAAVDGGAFRVAPDPDTGRAAVAVLEAASESAAVGEPVGVDGG